MKILELVTYESVIDKKIQIKTQYYMNSHICQIWSLSNNKFWVVKVSTGLGILCDTYKEALGCRRYIQGGYYQVERNFS